jgi:hypothetical protein
MLRAFMAWFDNYLSRTGVAGLVEGGLGVLAFGGALSVVLGDSSAKAGAIVAVLVATLGLILLLAASRAELRRRAELCESLLVRHCRGFMTDNASSWKLTRWIEHQRIDGNGDAVVLITVHAVVTCDLLRFYRFCVGSGQSQPTKARGRVDVQVRSVAIEGVGGTRREVTKHWLDDERLEVLVHFPVPVGCGSEFSVVIEMSWPARSKRLVGDRLPDDFCVRVEPPLDRLEYTVVLPAGEEACFDPIGFRPDDPHFALVSRPNGSGCQEISLIGRDVPVAGRIGLRVDLKRKASS